jgi:DNA-binding FadR family transcriptional regulator
VHGAGALYAQVADALRTRIIAGELPAGALLPAEADLAHEHGVGKDTVRDALAVLAQEGLIIRRRGARARVRERPEPQLITAGRGSTVSARPATAREQAERGMPAGTWVIQLVDAGGFGDIFPADQVLIRFE